MIIYIAILRDTELTSDEVLCAQSSFENLRTYVFEYFGISDVREYNNPAKFLGYTKFNYSEHEDDLDGYFTFDEDGLITKVYVFNKFLDEKI